MALQWFADEKVDMVVLETGLGGRLDSTNIVNPVLSVITNIGLDHCDMLGDTLSEIAFERAGITKSRVPVVIGETHPETAPVFERKVLYTNLPEPAFMGDRQAIMSLLTFADQTQPLLWCEHEDILARMDLQGAYQKNNLRTVLAALAVLGSTCSTFTAKLHQVPSNSGVSGALSQQNCTRYIVDALINTSKRTGFRGRWEKLSDNPLTICDIGHNEHGLRHNFAQLEAMKADGRCSDLIVVYGSVADKDVDSVLHLMPKDATYIFTQAQSKRALKAESIYEKFAAAGFSTERAHVVPQVCDAVAKALELALLAGPAPLIYSGGSTYVVSDAIQS
jgi:dihydrofolate synthase/folylpolyglutamate synthase